MKIGEQGCCLFYAWWYLERQSVNFWIRIINGIHNLCNKDVMKNVFKRMTVPYLEGYINRNDTVSDVKTKTILNFVTFQTTTINFVIYIWFVSWVRVELDVTNFSPLFLLSSGNYDSWLEWNKFPSTATTISSHPAGFTQNYFSFCNETRDETDNFIFLFILRHPLKEIQLTRMDETT